MEALVTFGPSQNRREAVRALPAVRHGSEAEMARCRGAARTANWTSVLALSQPPKADPSSGSAVLIFLLLLMFVALAWLR